MTNYFFNVFAYFLMDKNILFLYSYLLFVYTNDEATFVLLINANDTMLREVHILPSVFYEIRSENQFAGIICDHPFPSHVHDPVEIVCPTAGTLAMTISEQQYQLYPGDIAVVFPSVPHSYDYVSPDVEGLTLIFLPDTISEYSRTFRTMLPANPLLSRQSKAPELNGIIRSLIKLSHQESSPLQTGYLHLFLAYMFTCLPLSPIEKQIQASQGYRLSYQILHYISEHFTEPLTLESTAHALGISRIHLSHIFSQQLHVNFRQYINTLRIDRACKLLRDPSSTVSQVAYLCGYSNPRTFHRAFLSQCGMPPKQYRARLSLSAEPDHE